jgi:hypothetical protein
MTGESIRASVLAGIQTTLAQTLNDAGRLPTMRMGADRGRLSMAVRDAKAGIVRVDIAAWLMRNPSGAECKAVHRELNAMERDGLIELIGAYEGSLRKNRVRLVGAPA